MFFMIDFRLLVMSAYFYSYINSEKFFFFFVEKKKQQHGFFVCTIIQTIIIFNAIIWHNIYTLISLKREREGKRRERGCKKRERKRKKNEREIKSKTKRNYICLINK